MKTKANADIRSLMKDRNIAQWELAEMFGVCEMTVVRWLRMELPRERKDEIIQKILSNGKAGKGGDR